MLLPGRPDMPLGTARKFKSAEYIKTPREQIEKKKQLRENLPSPITVVADCYTAYAPCTNGLWPLPSANVFIRI